MVRTQEISDRHELDGLYIALERIMQQLLRMFTDTIRTEIQQRNVSRV